MKTFLFLYPLSDYVSREIGDEAKDRKLVRRLGRLIDVRYRQHGYRICWLFFSVPGERSQPDLTHLEPAIGVRAGDRAISARIRQDKLEKGNYPSPSYILDQLGDVDELVVGGFHRDDCVKRVARAAYKRGWDVFVDEDTTEWFFRYAYLFNDNIPLTRTREEYTQFVLRVFQRLEEELSPTMAARAVRLERRDRKRQPWLVQI